MGFSYSLILFNSYSRCPSGALSPGCESTAEHGQHEQAPPRDAGLPDQVHAGKDERRRYMHFTSLSTYLCPYTSTTVHVSRRPESPERDARLLLPHGVPPSEELRPHPGPGRGILLNVFRAPRDGHVSGGVDEVSGEQGRRTVRQTLRKYYVRY